ncbi:MAG TPA: peptidoglycan-binding protein LysM [Maritimibacter sp.]|nr:peptidoglycan-binding protein LysM [Maritimibacter sp.]
MGLWNFVKGAGKTLFGGEDAKNEEALKKEVEDLGVSTDGLEIKVDGDKVTVSGGSMTTEEKEKVILAVGNVDGIAAVEADVETETLFHTVEKGDTLWAVAQKTLGDGNRYNEIFEANKPMLTHPDKIYPGQVLRILT